MDKRSAEDSWWTQGFPGSLVGNRLMKEPLEGIKLPPAHRQMQERVAAGQHPKTGKPISGSELDDWTKHVQVYQSADRGHRSRSGTFLTNLAAVAALMGGGIGLARQIPKLLALSKLPKADKKKKETKQAQLTQISTDPKEWLGGRSPLPGWFGRPGMSGAAIPLIGISSLLGSQHLVDWITDKVRTKEMIERKKGLRKQFEEMLSKPASVDTMGGYLEKMASGYESQGLEKQAQGLASGLSKTTVAALTLIAMLTGGLGFTYGRQVRKKNDPNRVRQLALEHALRLRQRATPTTIALKPTAPEEVLELDEILSPIRPPLSRTPVDIPFILPEGRKKRGGEYDEALSLLKAGQWYRPDRKVRRAVGKVRRGVGEVRDTMGAVRKMPEEVSGLKSQLAATDKNWSGKYQTALDRINELDTQWGGRADAMQKQIADAQAKVTKYEELLNNPEALRERLGPALRQAGGFVGEGLPGGVYRGVKGGVSNAYQQNVSDPISALLASFRGSPQVAQGQQQNPQMGYMTGQAPRQNWWQSLMSMLSRFFGNRQQAQATV